MFGRKEVCTTQVAAKHGNIFAGAKEKLAKGIELCNTEIDRKVALKAELEGSLEALGEDIERDRSNVKSLQSKLDKVADLV